MGQVQVSPEYGGRKAASAFLNAFEGQTVSAATKCSDHRTASAGSRCRCCCCLMAHLDHL